MIRAQFRARATSESTTERSLHATRAEAQAAATAMAAELQEWIDTEEHPAQCARAREHGNPEPDREIASAEAEVDARVAETRADAAGNAATLAQVQDSIRALQDEINRRSPR